MDTIKQAFAGIVEQAARDGVFAELLLQGNEEETISFNNRKMKEFSSNLEQCAGIRVVQGSSQGYAWTENISEGSLFEAYQEALQNAKVLPPQASAVVLPLVNSQQPEKNLKFVQETPIAEKIEKARLLEEQTLQTDPRITSTPYCGFTEGKSWKRILNSQGMDQKFSQDYYSAYVYALAEQGESKKMSGQSLFRRQFKQMDIDQLVQLATQSCLPHLGASRLKTGSYPVVIVYSVFQSLLGLLSSYFSAKEVFEKTSLFEGKLGQDVASPAFTLIDDPTLEDMSRTSPFDAEGSAKKKTALIEKGELKNYLTNLEYSHKMNLPHTASAARSPATDMGIGASNLVVTLGTENREQLLQRYPRMILLTHLTAMHSGFKSSTGNFSLPGEGILYENGKPVHAVDQFVVSGNILDLLKKIEAVSDAYGPSYSGVKAPDVLIRDLSFAGGDVE